MSSPYMPTVRLVGALPNGAFPSRATHKPMVQVMSSTRESRTTYPNSTDPRLVNIPCRVAPMFMVRPTPSEEPGSTGMSEQGRFTCMLKGYFPEFRMEDRVTVDGVEYEITAVEHDGFKIITRLALLIRGV